jgi:hypothetical protein
MLSFLEYVNGKTIEKKRLEKIGDFTIFTVNASAIRNIDQGDDEFNHFATHMEFPKLVPNNEIWISRDISERERQFLIHNGMNQYLAKKKGKRNWYEYALKKEKAEREKVDKIKFVGKDRKTPPDKVYYKYYCGIPSENDDVEVWLVDGEIVRDLYKSDFIEGGNPEVYSWVPKGEIWIEKNLEKEKDEVDITILHEYIESTLMKYKKLTYNKAHPIASKVEFHHRNKKWDITDVKDLNREEALEMAKRYL